MPLLLDDGVLLQGVKYTDIDYDVFTDAARYVANGESPYKRHTYRYTPFLAVLLSHGYRWKLERFFGRFLFCLADAICGLVILKLRRQHRNVNFSKKQSTFPSLELQDALWWLYNPLPINICTRGSAESFVVLLLVLGSVSVATSAVKEGPRSRLWGKAVLSGMMHGMAIHTKLYPIIYTASFMSYFAKKEDEYNNNYYSDVSSYRWKVEMEKIKSKTDDRSNESKLYPFPWLKPKRFMKLVRIWLFRLLAPTSILFLVTSILTFGGFTFLAMSLYGPKALEEGLLYHFSRVDHRHNYSMFWYWIYLARSRLAKTGGDIASSSSLSTLGKALMVPQVILLLYSSLGIAPFDLSFALFVQTFLFVAMNKVITAQYFTWYLVLLPLCSERIHWLSREMFVALTILGMSMLVWLGSAFYLEIKGMAVHLVVWMSSVLFYFANVNILRVMLKNYHCFGNLPKVKLS